MHLVPISWYTDYIDAHNRAQLKATKMEESHEARDIFSFLFHYFVFKCDTISSFVSNKIPSKIFKNNFIIYIY